MNPAPPEIRSTGRTIPIILLLMVVSAEARESIGHTILHEIRIADGFRNQPISTITIFLRTTCHKDS